MAVVVHDLHGKTWEFPTGVGAATLPTESGTSWSAKHHLYVVDAAGNNVGGFNDAAWSHFVVHGESGIEQ